MKALLMRESTGDYQAVHEPSIITDANTGKKIRVQALGGYGILDINWDKWSKEAGFEGADWHDPKAQDAVAKYKVQQYFDRFQSWDAVSVAWFAGPNVAKRLVEEGTINYDKADSKGTTIKQYVDSMNNLIAEEFMTMEVPIEPITMPQIYPGPQTNPVIDKQRDNQQAVSYTHLTLPTKA